MLNSRASDVGRSPNNADSQARTTPHVWAIASGKGGVGKSVVASNFAVSLAGRGHTCALLDLDLGCANLHTMLGVSSGGAGLGRLLDKEVATLADALVPTGIDRLSLLSGDQVGPGTANLSYANKRKLIRQARRLEVEHVVLDLGAGTSFNVLDFFLEADSAIVVVVPEPTSIENTYAFLLSAFLRSLRAVTRRGAVRQALDRIVQRNRGRLPQPRDLLAAVVEEDAQAGVALWERYESFSASLIVNRVRQARHHELGPQIVRDAQRHFGATLRYAGAIAADDCVVSALVDRRPVLHQFPRSRFARDLETVATKLLVPDEQVKLPTAAVEFAATPAPSKPEIAEACVDLKLPGASLRLRREEIGLSLTECEHRTRIRCLPQIEAEQFDQLPPEQYLRAFVAQYAILLGIDEAASLAAAYIDRYQSASSTIAATRHTFVPREETPESDETPESEPKPDTERRARPRASAPRNEGAHRRWRRSRNERSGRRPY